MADVNFDSNCQVSIPKATDKRCIAGLLIVNNLIGEERKKHQQSNTLSLNDIGHTAHSFLIDLQPFELLKLRGLFNCFMEQGANVDLDQSNQAGSTFIAHEIEDYTDLTRYLPKVFKEGLLFQCIDKTQCWAMRTGRGAAVDAHLDMLRIDNGEKVCQFALLVMLQGNKLAITMTSKEDWTNFFVQVPGAATNEFGHPDLNFLQDNWEKFKKEGGNAFHLKEGEMLLIPAGHPHYVICLHEQGDTFAIGWEGQKFLKDLKIHNK